MTMINNETVVDKSSLIAFRNFTPEDEAFIFSTWLKGLKFGNSWFRIIDDKPYYTTYHALIAALIAKPGVLVAVACLKEDPTVILGYSVSEQNKLHWVHIKKAWRAIGLANDLVPKGIDTVTHLTDVGRSIMTKKNLKFNPFGLL